MPVPLCPTEILVLTGADATTFAQGQFTSDVTALASGTWQWSAWLDPQGRVRYFFALLRVEPDRFVAWLPMGGAIAMRDSLARYVMRSKVTIEAHADWTLHWLEENAAELSGAHFIAHDRGLAFAQPGTPRRNAWIAPIASSSPDHAALERWRLEDIEAGLPLLAPELGGEFVAQALDLERLDAIRFDKGCYPGQEIVARLHFRGGNKRRLQRLSIDGTAPAAGTLVVDSAGKNVGQILFAASSGPTISEGLGVLAPIEDAVPLATSAGQIVRIEGPFL